MKKLMIAGLVLATTIALGCGGEQSTTTDDSASESTSHAADVASGATAPEVAKCLKTVEDGEFETAVPICQEALAADPGNAKVQQALTTASSEIAKANADAAEGAMDAADEALDDAGEAIDAAKKDLGDAAEDMDDSGQ